jgi:hypothetical protein
MAFKIPDFTERTAAARAAKQRALDLLRNKPAPDEAEVAARQAARAAKDAAETERRLARQAAVEEAKAIKAAKASEAAAAALEAKVREQVPERPKLTEAEMKAARDARYAARKARKR